MSPEKTKPTVWLCPEASGWLKGVSPQRRQAFKKEDPDRASGRGFVFVDRCEVNVKLSPNALLFLSLMRDANFPGMTGRSSGRVITPAPQVRH